MQPLGPEVLPPGIRARIVEGVNGLDLHLLEAGYEAPGRPLVLLLHGFPELAYSWRKVMPALAAAGYHAVAPDQRGYGRTTGWSDVYEQDLRPFSMLALVRDQLALLRALGRSRAAAVVGHDFGSPVAAWAALVRPDVFPAAVLMSAPFAGAPVPGQGLDWQALDRALAALPRPRKHYQRYYATAEAHRDMLHCAQGVHAFLRAYFHHKSADWAGNRPHRLAAWRAEALAELPTYYVMDLARNMAATVAPEMPGAAEIATCRWLTEDELAVYSGEFARTGFQGGLNWYRTRFEPALIDELTLFAGRRIEVPSMFIAGKSDWGVYQSPGDFERMQEQACPAMTGCHLLDGAGHWVQQEQADRVAGLLLDFLREAAG